MMTDPIGDMLTRIRNAGQARHQAVHFPKSRLKLAVAQVLSEAGYLGAVSERQEDGRDVVVAEIRYADDGAPLIDGLRRVSRPSRRVYVAKDEIPRVRNGMGLAVLSTSRGVLSDAAAREAAVGGEVLCEVW
jgi:small subunit ribosomal protein S8